MTTETAPQINLDILLAKFHGDLTTAANCPENTLALITQLNPWFQFNVYSPDSKANLLANIVAGIYAPLTHAFSATILHNISLGMLPSTVIAPPRDTIPIAHSIRALATYKGLAVPVLQPSINRNIAGIANNQSAQIASASPLLLDYVMQELGPHINGGFTELEYGIYGTTTRAMVQCLRQMGIKTRYVSPKFYGLGPNLSYVHGLLTNGQYWTAEEAEINFPEIIPQVNQLMVIIDTLEEIGMANMYESPQYLMKRKGKIGPLKPHATKDNVKLATAANEAVISTAGQYGQMPLNELNILALHILNNVDQLMKAAGQGIPVALAQPIPSMQNRDALFADLRANRYFELPSLLL